MKIPKETKTTNVILAVTLAVIITLSVSFIGFRIDQMRGKQYAIKHNVYVIYERFTGTQTFSLSNIITHDGENFTRDAFTDGASVSQVSYIGVGNNTSVSASDTNIDTLHVGWGRQNGTIVKWINSGDSAFNCTYKFLFNATVNLNSAGSWWENGTGNNEMYAIANFGGGAQTFNNGENLTIRWVYTYDAQNDA